MTTGRRTWARRAGVVPLVLGLALGSLGCSGRTDRPVSYTAHDLATGNEVSVSDLRGRPVLLVSWTTWCRECDTELAGIQQFAASDAARGIAVVAVNLDATDAVDEIQAKIRRHGLTTALWRDRHNDFKRAFGTLGVPTTVLLDRDGRFVAAFPGAVDFGDDDVLRALERVRSPATSGA
jgi:peroxiredoxin